MPEHITYIPHHTCNLARQLTELTSRNSSLSISLNSWIPKLDLHASASQQHWLMQMLHPAEEGSTT
jgi:hypothetical protein